MGTMRVEDITGQGHGQIVHHESKTAEDVLRSLTEAGNIVIPLANGSRGGLVINPDTLSVLRIMDDPVDAEGSDDDGSGSAGHGLREQADGPGAGDGRDRS